jgi:hypothetical protein
MPTVHSLPVSLPAFGEHTGISPISEVALRVVVGLEGWELHVVGTATVICGHVAITARHVLDYVVRKFGARSKTNTNSNPDEYKIDYELKLYQVLPGPVYRIWKVYYAWACATDIAILHLELDRASTLPGEEMEHVSPAGAPASGWPNRRRFWLSGGEHKCYAG